MPPKKTVTVHVFESGDEVRVYPPVVVLDGAAGSGGGGGASGDEMEIVNHTGEDLIWNVDAGPFGNAVLEKAPKNKGKSPKKNSTTSTQGNFRLFTYQVLLVPSGRKATGNSDPVIIVEN